MEPTGAGEKIGVLKVRLYRPFAIEHFLRRCPATVKTLCGARPHQGARAPRRTALRGRGHGARRRHRPASAFRQFPKVIGGRYGLPSKEFTPAMVKAVFDELAKPQAQESLHRRHPRTT